MLTLFQIFIIATLYSLAWAALISLAFTTHRNLKRMYPEAELKKFLPAEDAIWILSSEIFIDHAAGGSWVRVRQGVYVDPHRAYEEFNKLMDLMKEAPLYNRNALCERERLIK